MRQHRASPRGAIIRNARGRGRVLLNEFESKELLSLYGIPTVETRIARSEDEAVKQAAEIGYPVVLKVFSETITHKTDVGGVKLNLANEEAVRTAYRAIKSSVAQKAGTGSVRGSNRATDGEAGWLRTDPRQQHRSAVWAGAAIRFGRATGRSLSQTARLALPPLNTTLAQRMMEQTRIFKALKGVRGRKPVNLAALESLLVRFSQLVVEQPWITEIDINPLLASPERLLALDARVVLQDPSARPGATAEAGNPSVSVAVRLAVDDERWNARSPFAPSVRKTSR